MREVEVLVDRALDGRTGAAEIHVVEARVAAVVGEDAGVGLQVAAELHLEVAVRRLEEEAVLPAGQHLLLLELLVDDRLDGGLIDGAAAGFAAGAAVAGAAGLSSPCFSMIDSSRRMRSSSSARLGSRFVWPGAAPEEPRPRRSPARGRQGRVS